MKRGAGTSRGSFVRRALGRVARLAVVLALAWAALLIVLIGLWSVVPPVSTLMLGRWATLRGHTVPSAGPSRR